MRVVSIIVEAPFTAWTTSAKLVEAVQAVAVPQDELMHVYAGTLPTGFGVVIFLLVPLEQAAATGCRLLLAAADSLELREWSLGAVRVWSPAELS
ncbi:hypothetical protein [Promicromonospora sp. NPDC090134]|uniref:hypothetical protein n=1 Tax=Promicromonospora sp. NPDC090134 TaxID=3364408 RepID=UPI0037FEC5AF